jgi:hypothetical protein
MRPRHRRPEQRKARRPAPSTLSLREALAMAETTVREEARIYELSPSAAAQHRARVLYRRASDLRQRREQMR